MMMDIRTKGVLGAIALGASTVSSALLPAGCGDSSRQVEKELTLKDGIQSPTHSLIVGLYALTNGDREESQRLMGELAAINSDERVVLEDAIRAYGGFYLLCRVATNFEGGDKFLLQLAGGRDYQDWLNDLYRDFTECRTPICDRLTALTRFAGKVDDEHSSEPLDLITRSPLERLARAADNLSKAIPNDPKTFARMLNETGVEGAILGSIGLSLADREMDFRRALIEFLAEVNKGRSRDGAGLG